MNPTVFETQHGNYYTIDKYLSNFKEFFIFLRRRKVTPKIINSSYDIFNLWFYKKLVH